MKIKSLSIFAAAALLLSACGEPAEQTETVIDETPAVETATYMADIDATNINWRGEVAGVYGHEGYINLKNGKVMVENGKITGGEFVVDMTGIYPTDTASYGTDEGTRIEDLQGHLANEDFFATETYPTSKFVIKSVNGNTIIGDLTIRDKTSEETLEVTSMEITENGMNMSGTLVFDRQKYDVAWVHYMKDMVLSDDIKLNFSVVTNKI